MDAELPLALPYCYWIGGRNVSSPLNLHSLVSVQTHQQSYYAHLYIAQLHLINLVNSRW